jgi:hypothetical protein
MTDKKLLTEWRPFEYTKEMIEESKRLNGGKIIMKGILQKADTLNQNGRIYPLPILEREVRNYQKFISENRALGECDHPESSVVELKNASHIVREAYMEGDVCFGTVEPSTPGAFMMREGKEISEGDLRKHFKKSDRVDRILNDIIGWNED